MGAGNSFSFLNKSIETVYVVVRDCFIFPE